jgi:hypothetical protein
MMRVSSCPFKRKQIYIVMHGTSTLQYFETCSIEGLWVEVKGGKPSLIEEFLEQRSKEC